MSSILRALRKLDHDSLSREPGSREQKIKMRQVLHRRTVNPRQVNRVLAVILVAALGAVAWLLIDTRQKPVPKPVPVKKEEIPLEKPTPAPLSQQASQQTSPLEKKLKTGSAGEATSALMSGEPARTPTGSVLPGSGLTTQPGLPGVKQGIRQLNFSGVLWSDKPGRRVALINDRYLKEGDEIDGVTVVKIEKKAVTLQRGTEKWTLKLKK